MQNSQDKSDAWLSHLSNILGDRVALFCICAASNVPYYQDIECETWKEYKASALERGAKGRKRYVAGFTDGLTDIAAVLDDDNDGMDEWRSVWGSGDTRNPYTIQDYKRLDKLFETYSARLVSAGGYDAQQEYILRSTCQDQLLAEKCRAKGTKEGIDMYAKLTKTIQENLSAENLRKKDEKPIETLRIDTLIDNLEKAGLVKEGKILALPDLQEQLLRRLGALGGEPSHKFPYTFDAADQMILAIRNCMAANSDMPEIDELPDNMRFDENVAYEFAELPNEAEELTYEKLGLNRKRDGKDKQVS